MAYFAAVRSTAYDGIPDTFGMPSDDLIPFVALRSRRPDEGTSDGRVESS